MGSKKNSNIKSVNKIRFEKFKEYQVDYKFSVKIKTLEDFISNLDNEMYVKHRGCGHTEKLTINEFMKKGSIFYKYESFFKHKNDYKCSKCMQKAKNKYYQEELKQKHNPQFTLISDYNKKDEPVMIKHKRCGEVFEINPSYYYSKKIVCKHCKKIDELNDAFDKKLKQLQINKEYKRLESIKSNTEVIKILHIPCSTVLEYTPNKFFYRKNKCSQCSYQETFGEKIVNEYKLLSEFMNLGSYIKLQHKKCGHIFEIRADNLLAIKRICPNCEKDDKVNMSLSLSERKKAYEKNLDSEYEILTKFFNHRTNIDIKHKKCGTIFKRRANNLKTKTGEPMCPKCALQLRKQKFLKDLKEKHGNKFELIGEYKGLAERTIFRHKKCGDTFEIKPTKLLKVEEDSCTNCSNNNYTTDSLKKKIYISTKGEYILVGEYVNAKTKVMIRHLKCGRVFTSHTYVFFNSINNNEGSLACKHCLVDRKRLGVNGLQDKLNKKFGKLFTVHGVYINANTDIPIQCNNCGFVKDMRPKNILTKKCCSNCKKSYL